MGVNIGSRDFCGGKDRPSGRLFSVFVGVKTGSTAFVGVEIGSSDFVGVKIGHRGDCSVFLWG